MRPLMTLFLTLAVGCASAGPIVTHVEPKPDGKIAVSTCDFRVWAVPFFPLSLTWMGRENCKTSIREVR